MMTNLLAEILAAKDVVLIDGAMGTQLFSRGLASGAPPETWNIDRPDDVLSIHRDYITAGSSLILTNSFGGTTFRLKLHDLQEQSYELNRAAAELARQAAAEADRPVVVAGSIGPSGEILEPMGQMEYHAAVESFSIQAAGLADGGVDLFWIETMSDLGEVRAAVDGIRTVSDRPISATMTFDTRGRTMMGVTPRAAAEALIDLGLAAIGGNCGNGPDEIEAVVAAMHEAFPEAIIIAKANAGIPQWINGRLEYDGTPAVMADYARRVRALGARIIGACCGSTPEHIAAMARALDEPADDRAAVKARGYRLPVSSEQSNSRRRGGRSRRRRRDP